MAVVLSCPRCRQSRTLTSVHQPCVCPFCHMELDPPVIPESEPVEAPQRPSRPRVDWLLLIGLAFVAALITALIVFGPMLLKPSEPLPEEPRVERSRPDPVVVPPAQPPVVLAARVEPPPSVVARIDVPLPPPEPPKPAPPPAAAVVETPKAAPAPAAARPARPGPTPVATQTPWPLPNSTLAEQLRTVPLLDLDPPDRAGTKRAEGIRTETAARPKHKPKDEVPHSVPELLAAEPEFAGLAWLKGEDCKTSPEKARQLTTLSVGMRRELDRLKFDSERFNGRPVDLKQLLGRTKHEGTTAEALGSAVGLLEQILQGEDDVWRRFLVTTLSAVDHPAATAALARRAVFDTEYFIRSAAVEALRKRPA